MLHWEDDFLKDTAKLEKLYRSCLQDAAAGYQLSPNETAVLLFLCHYAPEQDTATDIAQSRGISKALVARSGAASLPASGMKATAASCISACAGKAPQRRRSCRKAVGRLHGSCGRVSRTRNC